MHFRITAFIERHMPEASAPYAYARQKTENDQMTAAAVDVADKNKASLGEKHKNDDSYDPQISKISKSELWPRLSEKDARGEEAGKDMW